MRDRRLVPLSAGQNAATDFFLKTDVPMVTNVSGGILNDPANEFNPNTPNFGEKYAPPHLPVAFYDRNGKLVNRIYADQFGKFNAVLPSTYTADWPQPSGMAPNMLISCMNDAGPIQDSNNPGQMILDPFYNPQFSQFCYTFQYMPNVTTYLDTPVVPIAAFANPSTHPVDCERLTQKPVIAQISRHPGMAVADRSHWPVSASRSAQRAQRCRFPTRIGTARPIRQKPSPATTTSAPHPAT